MVPALLASAVLFLLLCSALFSASETALFSIPRERLWRFERSASIVDRWVFRLIANGQRTLLLILVGNTFVNITIVTLVYRLVEYAGLKHSSLVTMVAATALILICAEMTPKNIALRSNERVARLVAPLLYHLSIGLHPVMRLAQGINTFFLTHIGRRLERPAPFITAEEMGSALDMYREQGVIQPHEHGIIASVLRRGSQPVRRFMLHRSQVLTLSPDEGCAEAALAMRRRDRSFALVGRRGLPSGVVRVSAVLSRLPGEPVGRVMGPIEWVPGSMETAEVVAHMVETGLKEVGLLDEFGGYEGVFSLAIGLDSVLTHAESGGALDSPPSHGVLEREVDGLEHAEVLREWLPGPMLETAGEVRTLNGLIGNYLGRIPRAGESFAVENVTFYIIEAGPTAVRRVRIVKRGPNP